MKKHNKVSVCRTLRTLVVSCSSFLDEKPQSDFYAGRYRNGRSSLKVWQMHRQPSCRVRMRVLRQIYSSRENYTIGDVSNPIIAILAGDGGRTRI